MLISRRNNDNDYRIVMKSMVKAFTANKNDLFKDYVVKLIKVTDRNPFKPNTIEYEKFAEMTLAYCDKHMEKVYALASELCEIINYTEIYPERMTILGVLPTKKFRLKSLFKKEGDEDDS